ncbi:MAG: hypothetical protein SF069_17700 [Phycisphaerae bacterium]|nr:hypothetical protein [Phycisphaerae bacterium]
MMDNYRLPESTKVLSSNRPQSYSAGSAANGTAVNTAGFRNATLTVQVGDITTGSLVDVKVQESADGSTGWTDVTGAAIVQLSGDGGDNAIARLDLNLQSRKQYLRSVLTPTTSAVIAATTFTLYRPDGMVANYPIGQAITPIYV